jgi:hypothetical protein
MKSKRTIPEPFHRVVASTRNKTERIPMLVLRGKWLKAAGFPIGSNAYVVTDARGEIALHRIGLRPPRKLRVVAAKI